MIFWGSFLSIIYIAFTCLFDLYTLTWFVHVHILFLICHFMLLESSLECCYSLKLGECRERTPYSKGPNFTKNLLKSCDIRGGHYFIMPGYLPKTIPTNGNPVLSQWTQPFFQSANVRRRFVIIATVLRWCG